MRLIVAILLAALVVVQPLTAQSECPLSPRLVVGESGQVTVAGTGLDGLLRVRAGAGTEHPPLTDMPSGVTFAVVDGPVCSGGLNWYQIVTENGITGWSAEGTGSYFTAPTGSPNPDPLPSFDLNPVHEWGEGRPHSLTWSQDGGTLITGTRDGIRLYDRNLDPSGAYPYAGITAVARDNSSESIAAAAGNSVTIWMDSQTPIAHTMDDIVTALDWAGADRLMVGVGATLRVIHPTSGETLAEVALPGTVRHMAVSTDGLYTAAVYDGGAAVLDAETLANLAEFSPADTFFTDFPPLRARWHPQNADQVALLLDTAEAVLVWNWRTGGIFDVFTGAIGDDSPADFDWSPQGTEMVVVYNIGLGSGSVQMLIDVRDMTQTAIVNYADSPQRAQGVTWNPDGSLIAVMFGNSLSLYNTSLQRLSERTMAARVPAWGPDDRLVYLDNGVITDAITGDTLAAFEMSFAYDAVRWSPTGDHVMVIAGGDGVGTVFDARSGAMVSQVFTLSQSHYRWSADGTRIFDLYQGTDSLVLVETNINTGERTETPLTATGKLDLYLLSIGPTGESLVNNDGAFTVYSIAGDTLYNAETNILTPFDLSSNGQRLVLPSAVNATLAELVTFATGDVLPLIGHEHPITRLAFNPGMTRIATGDAGGVIRLWDASTGRLVWTRDAHSAAVDTLLFNPSGTQLLSSSFIDGYVRLWMVE